MLFFVLLTGSAVYSQIDDEADKCGIPLNSKSLLTTDNWGYSYDDLIVDLAAWETHPFATVDVIGNTQQFRNLYRLTIQNPDIQPIYRIHIHARTHPNEVQSTWVTNEIIDLLLSDSEQSNRLLSYCVVNIIPMINPDGVELAKPRKNASDIDIESNWDSPSPEDEVAALKALFEGYMDSELPARIALNMHSAYACKRYFVYHDSYGTNANYAAEQLDFIESIQAYFPTGIEDWDYYISWTTGTPDYYPESWFWNNYQDDVMALTYEDMNCDEAKDYDITAMAMVAGMADFLNIEAITDIDQQISARLKIYPNPVNTQQTLNIDLPVDECTIQSLNLISIDGRKINIAYEQNGANKIAVNFENATSGIYFLDIRTTETVYSSKVVLVNY